MDLSTLVWVIGTCLAIQQYPGGHLFILRLESNSRGAKEPELTMIEESKLSFFLEVACSGRTLDSICFCCFGSRFWKCRCPRDVLMSVFARHYKLTYRLWL